MRIGCYTIRRTSDIEAEQAASNRAKALLSTALIGLRRRSSHSEGLIGQEADNSQEATSTPPRGGPQHIDTPSRQLDDLS